MKSVELKTTLLAVIPWTIPRGYIATFMGWGSDLELSLRIFTGFIAAIFVTVKFIKALPGWRREFRAWLKGK